LPPIHAHVLRRARVRATAAAGVLTAVALAVGGCSSSDSSTPAAQPPTPSSTAKAPAQVKSKVVIGTVAGVVQPKNRKQFVAHRKRLENLVGGAVDGWLDGAFVGVDYPRAKFPTAFRTFMPEARQNAHHDKRLMTLWRYRQHINGTTTLLRKIAIDVLAPKGRPAGATARVDLRFKTHGKVTKKLEVKGRLFLAKDAHGHWRIFGYDVTQGGLR
jgi:hypothetical protein